MLIAFNAVLSIAKASSPASWDCALEYFTTYLGVLSPTILAELALAKHCGVKSFVGILMKHESILHRSVLSHAPVVRPLSGFDLGFSTALSAT